MKKQYLKKLMLLIMIVQFGYLRAWSQTTQSSTGEINDTTKVLIDINYIKKANLKLIQYNILKKKIVLKDSIIYYQNKKIDIYSDSYNQMKNYAIQANTINEQLNKDIERYKRKNKIYGGVAGGLATSLLLFIIIK